MTSIAFITTCKSRLPHVQQTLPLMVGEAPDEIIFVDYGCPQQSGDWVHASCPGVNVIRVADDPGFCVARARNVGAAASTSDWLCFIDADVMVAPGWVSWLRKNLRMDGHWRAARLADGKRDRETWGTMLCPREMFERIGGYDEVYRGWGGEDADLYLRLAAAGLPERNYPLEFVQAISHDDAMRVVHDELKDLRLRWAISNAYRDVKLNVSMPFDKGRLLALETRQSIMKEITRRVRQLGTGVGTRMPAFTIDLDRDSQLTGEFRLQTKASFSFDVVLRAGADE